MLYAHGPDLCHESDLRHAMANCFEALMGKWDFKVCKSCKSEKILCDSNFYVILPSSWKFPPYESKINMTLLGERSIIVKISFNFCM